MGQRTARCKSIRNCSVAPVNSQCQRSCNRQRQRWRYIVFVSQIHVEPCTAIVGNIHSANVDRLLVRSCITNMRQRMRPPLREAVASAILCKNNRLRLWFLFQLRSPVRFVCDAYCFCIAHSIGRPLPGPLSDPLLERYQEKYFFRLLQSRYRAVTQPLLKIITLIVSVYFKPVQMIHEP